MVPRERWRKHLGARSSAALPLIWETIRRKDWTLADLARAVGADAPTVNRIAYGDRKPGRRLSLAFLNNIGVAQSLWDEPCPDGWTPHKSERDSVPPPSPNSRAA